MKFGRFYNFIFQNLPKTIVGVPGLLRSHEIRRKCLTRRTLGLALAYDQA